MNRSAINTWRRVVFGLLCVAAIPVVAHAIRGQRRGNCDWDGRSPNPSYQVKIVAGDSEFLFCGVDCAGLWLTKNRHMTNLRVLVRDEESGREINATDAVFVRSTVVTDQVTGNRIHIFGKRDSAKRHIEAFRGRFLESNPLRTEEQ